MCDSFAALPPATRGNKVIMGKSADCRVNEAHALQRFPRAKHPKGEMVLTTHLTIPQAPETYEIFLGKSFWTWGAEIGMNEFGLAIGNEAIHTTVMKDEKKDGLITMDLLRLGLERARTCREAVEVMGALVHEFGQGGNCELPGNSHFDASYMLADTSEAWVLETAGREWAAKRVGPATTISNTLTITDDWDLCSLSMEKGSLDWRERFVDLENPNEPNAVARQCLSASGLAADNGKIDLKTGFRVMRDHGTAFDPAIGNTPRICMHAGAADRVSAAVGAMVTEVGPDGIVGWFTGTANTCISIFKPVFPGVALPDLGPLPTESYNPQSMWWQAETLNRRVIADFTNLAPQIREEFDRLEDQFIHDAEIVRKASIREKEEFVVDCFRQARQATDIWSYRVRRTPLSLTDENYAAFWQRTNAEAGIGEVVGW